jgi:ABC-type microcin C transport system duplicated ATPase subunit YejF
MRPWRRLLQVVFQNPYSSLNPRLRIRYVIAELLVNYGISGGRELGDPVEELTRKLGSRAPRRSTASRTRGAPRHRDACHLREMLLFRQP